MAGDRDRLDGVHAVVTGASRGIGAAISRSLAAHGASVTLMARSIEPLLELSAELSAAYPQSFTAIAVDVTDVGSVREGFERCKTEMGDPGVLVNNAGAVEAAAFARTDPEVWARMIAVNATSAYLCAREVVESMVDAGQGRIINIASTAGLRGYAYISAYAAAKHALVGFSRSLAEELRATGVTVNAVCPGFTDTPMLHESAERTAQSTRRATQDIVAVYARSNASGRLITPEEVAERVTWICLPEQRKVNGEAIEIE